MKLTKRLEMIASLVDKDTKIADIGTDHGYIPLSLLEKNIIKSAILSDINKGPLENAKNEVSKMGLNDKVDLRLGGGLTVLKDGEVDEVIIAGMGGILIAEIIDTDYELCKGFKKMILQPMQAQEELRKYLVNNGFEIIGEHITNEDFRIYQIIEAKYNPSYKFDGCEIDYEIPRKLVESKSSLLKTLIEHKIKECDKIIKTLSGVDTEETIKRLKYIKSRKKELLNTLDKF